MFQSLRPNSQVYILHKDNEPKIDTGYVINQPVVKPKYQLPMSFGQTQETIVDISVRIGDKQIVNYNSLPANSDIAETFSNGETIIITDNRDAMNAELLSNKQKNQTLADNRDYYLQLATSYEKLLSDINPEYAEKQAQKSELESLKSQMLVMSKNIEELMSTNRSLIERVMKN